MDSLTHNSNSIHQKCIQYDQKYLTGTKTSIKAYNYAVKKYGVKGRSPLWGLGAKPLVGSKGEALGGCSRLLHSIYIHFFYSTLLKMEPAIRNELPQLVFL
jgi:hypothetical protein